jgi:hypothetical protein
MCNQIHVLKMNVNVSKPENIFGILDSSYTDDSVLKYDGISDFRIKLYMFQEYLFSYVMCNKTIFNSFSFTFSFMIYHHPLLHKNLKAGK